MSSKRDLHFGAAKEATATTKERGEVERRCERVAKVVANGSRCCKKGEGGRAEEAYGILEPVVVVIARTKID